jgi:DnaJ-class molecular chaperone
MTTEKMDFCQDCHKNKTFTFIQPENCSSCSGSGKYKEKCSTCLGHGNLEFLPRDSQLSSLLNFILEGQLDNLQCYDCQGTGYHNIGNCRYCGGLGQVLKSTQVRSCSC